MFMFYGLIGQKLGYSYSKLIHEMLGEYEYNLIPLSPDEVLPYIRQQQFNGLNVTIPYKQTVFPLCERITELAQEIGAVNTLYFDEEKRLCGTNTDYNGFLYMAKRAGISFEGKKVLILGDGGASLAVRKAISDQGAKEIFIATRKDASQLNRLQMESGSAVSLHFVAYDHLLTCDDVDVIINTTPIGTYPNNGQYMLDLSMFQACSGVLDLIYNPFMTDILFQARNRGITYSNGLPMLVAQATKAAELFTGKEDDFQKENERIIKAIEVDLSNIILIGMPGSGKTTIGTLLAERLGKPFVDLDKEIVETAGMPIPAIFDNFGENAFRDMETALARDFGKKRGQVIATGGGVILKPENMVFLKQNGIILFIGRPLSKLAMEGRPLSTDIDALNRLYNKRLPLYNKYSDYIIECSDNVSDNVDKIILEANIK